MEWAAALKYQRNEYAKRIRKQYEAGELQERRCNMREITTRDDGISNTLTTVLKDNYIIVACRGRYTDGGGTTSQKLEPRGDIANTITTVQKDNLVLEIKHEGK